jgi:hypothetical protein
MALQSHPTIGIPSTRVMCACQQIVRLHSARKTINTHWSAAVGCRLAIRGEEGALRKTTIAMPCVDTYVLGGKQQ